MPSAAGRKVSVQSVSYPLDILRQIVHQWVENSSACSAVTSYWRKTHCLLTCIQPSHPYSENDNIDHTRSKQVELKLYCDLFLTVVFFIHCSRKKK